MSAEIDILQEALKQAEKSKIAARAASQLLASIQSPFEGDADWIVCDADRLCEELEAAIEAEEGGGNEDRQVQVAPRNRDS